VKFAKYYELGREDVILTICTDSMEHYRSRLEEMRERDGDYTDLDAARDLGMCLKGISVDDVEELRQRDRRRIHNLKYFTWIEQQGKDLGELMSQWDDRGYWTAIQKQGDDIDELIKEFNGKVGLRA
jgi:cysteine synthase A